MGTYRTYRNSITAQDCKYLSLSVMGQTPEWCERGQLWADTS
jgi:hypothetical protein